VPQSQYVIPAGATDAYYEISLPEGLLTHLCVSTTSAAQQAGDTFVTVCVYHPDVGYQRPTFEPISGTIFRESPLFWQGFYSLEPGYKIAIRYIGEGATTIVLSYERLTPNYIKAIGDFTRAVLGTGK